jgi:ribosomal protein S18 acetylase RimI-like enzyme
MDDRALAARQAATQRALYALFTPAIPGGSLVTLDGGVQAAFAPSSPDRSLFNAVLYTDGDALLRARDELDAAYAAAGVRAWTVWVRPGDERVARELEAAGHAHDARPMLMAADVDALDLEPRADLEADVEPTWATLAEVNDAAYGVPPERSFRPALGGLRHDAAPAWIGRLDGRPAAALATHVHDGDCGVTFVAVRPEAQGRGLAAELMRRALAAARDAGATTTSLEATARGEPVYAALGYRSLGRLGMWERRRADV